MLPIESESNNNQSGGSAYVRPHPSDLATKKQAIVCDETVVEAVARHAAVPARGPPQVPRVVAVHRRLLVVHAVPRGPAGGGRISEGGRKRRVYVSKKKNESGELSSTR